MTVVYPVTFLCNDEGAGAEWEGLDCDSIEEREILSTKSYLSAYNIFTIPFIDVFNRVFSDRVLFPALDVRRPPL